jgi:hypothetical protein
MSPAEVHSNEVDHAVLRDGPLFAAFRPLIGKSGSIPSVSAAKTPSPDALLALTLSCWAFLEVTER